MSVPTDPLFAQQWHLLNTRQSGGSPQYDLNVTSVWDDYTGQGVDVGVIDNGIDYVHPDLDGNYDDTRGFGMTAVVSGAASGPSLYAHGTSVAGLIAAEAGNGLGGVGVAPDATIVGFRALGSGTTFADLVSAMRQQVDVDVSNNSWSYTTLFADNLENPGFRDLGQAMSDVVAQGRGGLGTALVFSAGNMAASGDNTNYHGINSSRLGIEVAAVEADGTISAYSTPGASILVSAFGSGNPGSVVTTDVRGAGGSDPGDYTGTFSGTSASAPMVSGIIALMLEANPSLGYRDVQEILGASARQTDASQPGWQVNGADGWNGGGMHVSHQYGFGLVDAHAAVRLAETWTDQHTAANLQGLSATSAPNAAIPDQGSTTDAITIGAPQDLRLDHVEVDLDIAHSWIGDLTVTLISPTGTSSVLIANPGMAPGQTAGIKGDGGIHFTTTSTQHWGETANGTWSLKVTDAFGFDTGVLESWTLKLYGDVDTGDDRLVFTDEYAAMAAADPSRAAISDAAGIDTFNAAAVTSAMVIDLRPGAQSQVAGAPLAIDAGTVIENAYGGDGNDVVIGNAAANQICGGRGNDLLYGEGGQDVFVFRSGCGVDTVMDFTAGAGTGDIIDLRALGIADPLAFWDDQIADTSGGVLVSLTPEDAVLLDGVSLSQITVDDFWL